MVKYLSLFIVLLLSTGSAFSQGDPVFVLKSPEETGVDFRNDVPEDFRTNIILYPYHFNGGGVAIGDINNDGLEDIYFTSNAGDDKLYVNLGDMKFKEIGAAAGVTGFGGWKTGVTMADVNGDGWLDIYVGRSGDNAYGPSRTNLLFINQQNNSFKESAINFGLDQSGYTTQTAFMDLDADGDLDAYVLNHNVKETKYYDVEAGKSFRDPNVSDRLLINEGGIFRDRTEEWRVKGYTISYGLGVGVADFDKNGLPDIYVGNDFMESDYFYVNQGGMFEDQLQKRVKHISNFSMGLDIADLDNDGELDIYVVDMVAEDHYRQKTNMKSMDLATFQKAIDDGQYYQYMMNTLQWNVGNGLFSEVGKYAGVTNTDWSWSPLIADFDNDGLKDIFVSNGLRKDVRNNDYVIKLLSYLDSLGRLPDTQKNVQREIETALDFIPSQKVPNYFFHNKGKLKFEKMNGVWAEDIPTFSNGAAYGDLDNDGDLDLVINNLDDVAFVYENQTNGSKNFLRVKLKGSGGNTSGIGTKIWVTSSSGEQYQEFFPTRGFQSASGGKLHFGMGDDATASVRVVWPSGKMQQLSDVSVNKEITLSESDASESYVKEDASERLFTDVSGDFFVLPTRHRENKYDDYSDQLLLPHKMSQMGPALAIGDVNGDGNDDFYFGGASGISGKILSIGSNGKFEEIYEPFLPHKASEDIGAHFFDFDGDGDLDLYVVSGGYAFDENDPALQDRMYVNNNGEFSAVDVLPEMLTSGGVAISSDFDGDGDLDLFVGGRQVPRKYPFTPRSYLLQNNGGVFEDVTSSVSPAVEKAGMITSASWADFNGDGAMDLVVAGEWMEPMILIQTNGQLLPSTVTNPGSGWYFGLETGDFDGDGDIDVLLGNLGLNYKYKASEKKPFEIYAEDMDGNGNVDIVLGYYEDDELLPVRGRQCSSDQLSFIKDKFPTYDAFGKASLVDIYEDKLNESLNLVATNFAHVMWVNNGGEFSVQKLPWQAQLSPVTGFIYSDFDGDGIEDILGAGNLHVSEVETPRADAGMGFMLKGSGNGEYEWVPNKSIGLYLDGDVKNIGEITLNGVRYLVVARNDDTIKIVRVN